jgi:hypothetical protein
VNNNQLEDKDVETLQGRYEPIVQEEDPDNLKERIKLARKAFGSYHVAALLCKMDYSLWVCIDIDMRSECFPSCPFLTYMPPPTINVIDKSRRCRIVDCAFAFTVFDCTPNS